MVLLVFVLMAGVIVSALQSSTLRSHVADILIEILVVLMEINPIKNLDEPLKAIASFAANPPVQTQILPVYLEAHEETFQHIIFLLTVGIVFVVGLTLSVFGLAAYAKLTKNAIVYDQEMQLARQDLAITLSDLCQDASHPQLAIVDTQSALELCSPGVSAIVSSCESSGSAAADDQDIKRRVDDYLARLKAERIRGNPRAHPELDYSFVVASVDKRLEAARRRRLGDEKFGVASTDLYRHAAAPNSLGLAVHGLISCRSQSQVLTPRPMQSQPKLESANVVDCNG